MAGCGSRTTSYSTGSGTGGRTIKINVCCGGSGSSSSGSSSGGSTTDTPATDTPTTDTPTTDTPTTDTGGSTPTPTPEPEPTPTPTPEPTPDPAPTTPPAPTTTTHYYKAIDSNFRAKLKSTSLDTINKMKSPTWRVVEITKEQYDILGQAYYTMGTSCYMNPDYFVPEY